MRYLCAVFLLLASLSAAAKNSQELRIIDVAHSDDDSYWILQKNYLIERTYPEPHNFSRKITDLNFRLIHIAEDGSKRSIPIDHDFLALPRNKTFSLLGLADLGHGNVALSVIVEKFPLRWHWVVTVNKYGNLIRHWDNRRAHTLYIGGIPHEQRLFDVTGSLYFDAQQTLWSLVEVEKKRSSLLSRVVATMADHNFGTDGFVAIPHPDATLSIDAPFSAPEQLSFVFDHDTSETHRGFRQHHYQVISLQDFLQHKVLEAATSIRFSLRESLGVEPRPVVVPATKEFLMIMRSFLKGGGSERSATYNLNTFKDFDLFRNSIPQGPHYEVDRFIQLKPDHGGITVYWRNNAHSEVGLMFWDGQPDHHPTKPVFASTALPVCDQSKFQK